MRCWDTVTGSEIAVCNVSKMVCTCMRSACLFVCCFTAAAAAVVVIYLLSFV